MGVGPLMPETEAPLLTAKSRKTGAARLAALGAGGAFLAFCVTALSVRGGRELGWERALLLGLREPGDPADPLGPEWFEASVMDITALGGFAVLALATLLAVGFLLTRRQLGSALTVAIAVCGGTALSEGLKAMFARTRPDFVAHIVETTSMSFPSGHAMLSAVTYLTLGALLAQAQEQTRLRRYILGAAIVVTLLIGVTRVYLGVHWPTDVLAGWCLGASWALLCWSIASWLGARAAPH